MRKVLLFSLHLVLFSTISYGQRITVGVWDNPPLVYIDESGNPTGVFYDLLDHIANEEGWDLDVTYGSFNEIFESVQNSEIDVMSDLARAEYRDSMVLFNEVSIIPTWGQVFSKDNSIKTLADLQGKKIVYVENSFFIENPRSGLRDLMKEFGVNADLIPVKSFDEVFNSIENGVVDVGVMSRIIGTVRFQNQTFLDFNKIYPTPIIFAPVNLHYAFPLGDPKYLELANTIDQYITELKKDKSSAYYEIIQEHMFPGGSYSYPEWILIIFIPIIAIFALQYSFNSILRNLVEKKTKQLKNANQRIRENEARIKLAMESTQEGVFDWHITTDKLIVDELIMDQFGIAPMGIAQSVSNIRKLVHPDDTKLFRSSFEKFVEGKMKSLHRVEVRLENKQGEYNWVSISGKVVEWDKDQPTRYLGTISNIQDKKIGERTRELLLAALKERNKELRCLYRTSQLITDPAKSIPEVLDLTVNIIPESWQYPLFTRARITYFGKNYDSKGFKKGDWFQETNILVNNDIVGTIEVYYLKEMPPADEGPFLKEERQLLNSLSSILGAMIDRSNIDNQIEQKEIAERERILKELHDGVQQTLTVASINLNYLNNKLPSKASENGLKAKLDVGIENVTKAIQEIRDIAHELDIDYVPAVERLLHDLENVSEIHIEFFQNLQQQRLEASLERNLYRITQEAINNILKHSKALNATIQLMKYPDLVILIIEDDGIGFDLNSNTYGFGLNGIKHRSRNMNAVWLLDSSPGKGTSITVEVPIIPINASS